ncbi:unnamed protein product [Amoebophrya sp. A120]|nr:unnamed protein product [Amoebophrya sp. A120]|eukprot:GSA120T00011405001.1
MKSKKGVMQHSSASGYHNSFTPDRFLFSLGTETEPWGYFSSFVDIATQDTVGATTGAAQDDPVTSNRLLVSTKNGTNNTSVKQYCCTPHNSALGVQITLDPNTAPFKKFTYTIGWDKRHQFHDKIRLSNLPLALKRWWLELRRTKLKVKDAFPRTKEEFKNSLVYCLSAEFAHNKQHKLHPSAKMQGLFKGREKIYSRTDVYPLRTADEWRKRGRRVLMGEKGVERKTPLVGGSEILFAVWQTEDRPVYDLHANMVALTKEMRYNNAVDRKLASTDLLSVRNKYGHWDCALDNFLEKHSLSKTQQLYTSSQGLLRGASASSSSTSKTASIRPDTIDSVVIFSLQQEEKIWVHGDVAQDEQDINGNSKSELQQAAPQTVKNCSKSQFAASFAAPAAAAGFSSSSSLGFITSSSSSFGGGGFGTASFGKLSSFGSSFGAATQQPRFLDSGKPIPVETKSNSTTKPGIEDQHGVLGKSSRKCTTTSNEQPSGVDVKILWSNDIARNCAWVPRALAKEVCRKHEFDYIEAASGWTKDANTNKAQRLFTGVLLCARHAIQVWREAEALEKTRQARRNKKEDDELRLAWTELCKKILVERYMSRKRKR